MTIGKRNRIFLEGRLKEVKAKMVELEDSLKSFQERHRTVSIDDETKAAIATMSDLKARIMSKEITIGVMEGYLTERNPELIKTREELTELKKKLSDMERGVNQNEFGVGFSIPLEAIPRVSLQYARLFRDVTIQQELFSLLTEQYEKAKIQEVQDTPTVEILDRASPPEERSFPKRKRMVVIAFVFSLFVGIGLAFLFEYTEKIGKRKEGKEWQAMGNVIRKDFDAIRRKMRRRIDTKTKGRARNE
jgi:uncharacterized protein involved in exopolysaccharide biosynthesis